MQSNITGTQAQSSDFENDNLDDQVIIQDEHTFPTEDSIEFIDQKITDDKEASRFKDGEKLTMIRVRFPGNAKSFPFLIGKRKFAYGQKVVAMSDRGMTVGYINSFPYEVIFNKSMLPIRSISKVATEEDIKAQIEFRDSEKKAEVICLRLIEKYQLDMVLTHVEFTQFGKKAVFYFNAPARVDFRDLVKDLVYELKMRIELRQISVRDRAAALGSVGACGLQTCCSSFLKNYGNVSIKMAKNQNLALIPSKLNGVCGQIKCCIKYEDEVYSDKRKQLPREGSFIKTFNGDKGKVLKLNILVEQFEMLTDGGIKRRYSANQYSVKESELGQDYRFPDSFENIINETQNVIGLTKEEKISSDFYIKQQEITFREDKAEDQSNQSEKDLTHQLSKEHIAPTTENRDRSQQRNNHRQHHHNRPKNRHSNNRSNQNQPNSNKKN